MTRKEGGGAWTHLVPRFGHRRLDQIDTASVQRLRADLAKKRKSPKTVENILSVLRKLLKVAIEWDELAEMFPRSTSPDDSR